ncbi:MAG: hypothetical protein QOF58_1149 [Pseudonocardiales bacterium]|jgi:hypothetical protein|nr:hypothetical protein [Pseudonocardiales bacterium]
MGVVEVARQGIGAADSQSTVALKENLVRWVSTAATSDRKMADDLEKLGPMSSDVQNPHDQMIKSLRREADGWDDMAGRVRALAADDKFVERYVEILTNREVRGDSAEAMFKQIVDIPKYKEVFRANQVCADWQKLAGGK